MKLDVHVKGKNVAQLYRERDEYVLKYRADAQQNDSRQSHHARSLRAVEMAA